MVPTAGRHRRANGRRDERNGGFRAGPEASSGKRFPARHIDCPVRETFPRDSSRRWRIRERSQARASAHRDRGRSPVPGQDARSNQLADRADSHVRACAIARRTQAFRYFGKRLLRIWKAEAPASSAEAWRPRRRTTDIKGFYFNLFEAVVTKDHGGDTWDAMLEAAGLDGAYTSLGNYPDDDVTKLVAAASSALGIPAEAVLRWFGREALPLLAERYPSLFSSPVSAQSFILTLNEVVHSEVRKLYPGADVPDFEFHRPSEETLVVTYRSRRKLCALAEGMIDGSARYYAQVVKIEQPLCMNRGDDRCELVCTFSHASG